jgi:hypothetical protein
VVGTVAFLVVTDLLFVLPLVFLAGASSSSSSDSKELESESTISFLAFFLACIVVALPWRVDPGDFGTAVLRAGFEDDDAAIRCSSSSSSSLDNTRAAFLRFRLANVDLVGAISLSELLSAIRSTVDFGAENSAARDTRRVQKQTFILERRLCLNQIS